jgi:serine/threonine-protein kinase
MCAATPPSKTAAATPNPSRRYRLNEVDSKTIELAPEDTWAWIRRGHAYVRLDQCDKAIADFLKVIALDPKDNRRHFPTYGLGKALEREAELKGSLDEAIAEYRETIRLQPDNLGAHICLAEALSINGWLEEAVPAYREVLRLQKDQPNSRGMIRYLLVKTRRLDEAIAECREAIRLEPNNVELHESLITVLLEKGQLDEAIAECREALRVNKPDFEGFARNPRTRSTKRQQAKWYEDLVGGSLVRALGYNGKWDEAIAECRARVKMWEALEAGREKDRASTLLRWAELMARLDQRLPRVLEGKDQLKDAAERLGFAQLCQMPYRKQHAAAARLYAEAFAADPKLAADPNQLHRYNAACAAALAGCRQGRDTAGLDDEERARLRRQALDWLRADREAWDRYLDKVPEKGRGLVANQLRHWLWDPDFAGVRGPEALAKLPEAEQQPWQQLWDDVADMLARGLGRTTPEKK